MVNVGIGLAVGALLLFGGWVVTAGLATRSVSAVNAVFLSYVASLGIIGIYVLLARRPITGTQTDLVFALLSGVFLAIGTVSFYGALTRGDMAIVSAIAALYFIVPVVVDVVYFETNLGATTLLGLGLAVVAVVLITV
ncbi:EamA family transporter [Natronorubrum sp. A-ect3]|uniref:EamA family transporter n=1 Tax=Natronorubrum sp. A-ect3 TaxID=3242698 RepID=UPI00359D3A36